MVGVAAEVQETRVDQPGSLTPRRLAPGTELLGEYEASAFTQPRYLLRRADGQVIQLTRLLYLVISALGSEPGIDLVACVSEQFGRQVTADNIKYLIDQKLAPLGVLAPENVSDEDVCNAESAEVLTRANPLLLGLRFRTRVVPERFHRGASRALRPLFWPPMVLATLAAFAAFDGWLLTTDRYSK